MAPEKFPDYTLRSGEFYHHISNKEDASTWKLCVETTLRQRVMNEVHDSPNPEHIGIKETVENAAAQYYWPRMFRDIKRYIRQRARCQITKQSEKEGAGTGETNTTLVVDKATKKRRNRRSQRSTEEKNPQKQRRRKIRTRRSLSKEQESKKKMPKSRRIRSRR
ncbi:unnamed protein product [Ceratitis capitata]|uniref:(Mediterranean fruit fly) hypothetical protein n=1 Tax=Ceratitis capitata TaxID=7213 RepID=A0A811UVA9_CERCA|nr:unnamed protein product [Ceratitis capitata]